MQIVFSLCNH